MPNDDLLEEVEAAISLVSIREISERGVPAVWLLEDDESRRETDGHTAKTGQIQGRYQ